jgi:hypothetical protein
MPSQNGERHDIRMQPAAQRIMKAAAAEAEALTDKTDLCARLPDRI